MSARIDVVDPGVVRIALPDRASHAYLFLGKRLALVDCGTRETSTALMVALRDLDVSRHAISLLILTHEHEGHAGAAGAFPEAIVAAHPLAAAKLRYGDDEATRLDAAHLPSLELAGGSVVHIGGFSFDVIHAPGHTSGSICLYERARGLLVTGDTAFAEGTPTGIDASGSRGDQVSTLERLALLPARLMLPGHGRISDDPQADLGVALEAARSGQREPSVRALSQARGKQPVSPANPLP